MSGNGSSPPRRSLILAGGGMKVAFQAGVLQVWLDEADLTFDHADGAGAGTFNLAMLCQGMSGTEIADRWRAMRALDVVQLNWRSPLRLFGGESIAKLNKLRARLFRRRFGLDWNAINASPLEATFGVYNFSDHELEVVTADRMNEDLLAACAALPMWFPPVLIDGRTYIDSVHLTAANIEEAIRRGADELWVIWTISERSHWNRGFVGTYFNVVETTANGHFRGILRRIEESNAAIARGEPGEFGRHIEVKIVRGEVPLHYVLNVNSDRFAEAVELGVTAGRRWCAEQGIPLRSADAAAPSSSQTLSFSETMRGEVAFGETGFGPAGGNGRRPASPLRVHLTITADDLERFMHQPEHEARVEGEVVCEDLGGRLPIERGTFNLFVDQGDPAHKRMLYRLFFADGVGHPLTLTGFKVIEAETGRGVWRDTTTLYTRVLKGHVEPGEDDDAGVVAAGIIHVQLLDFLHQLTTFRARTQTRSGSAAALARFGTMFVGSLWDVYARRILSSSPF